MMKPGRAVHPSNGTGTAPDAAVTEAGVEIDFTATANRSKQSMGQVLVSNLEAAGGNSLEVSFSEGALWFSIPPATTVPFDIKIHTVRLRGTSGATSAYSIMGIQI